MRGRRDSQRTKLKLTSGKAGAGRGARRDVLAEKKKQHSNQAISVKQVWEVQSVTLPKRPRDVALGKQSRLNKGKWTLVVKISGGVSRKTGGQSTYCPPGSPGGG